VRRRLKIFLAVLAVVSVSCAGNGGKSKQQRVKHFPQVQIPSVYSDPLDKAVYVSTHFWDDFSGVPDSEIEKALADFIGLVGTMPLPKAQGAMSIFFDRISSTHAADTSKRVYIKMTQLVAKYLYDPNSPLRNEDLYLPFVRAMASSPWTSEEMKSAYKYEAESCALCQEGTVAPDFRVRTIKGTTFNMHSVKADFSMLFFSNPGCTACKSIIDDVQASEKILKMISDGTLAVLNVYIDEDLKAWREYEHNYPKTWHTGYDPDYLIRGKNLYPVRAIPSLYLLDKEKRILMKDAPTEKVIRFLETLN